MGGSTKILNRSEWKRNGQVKLNSQVIRSRQQETRKVSRLEIKEHGGLRKSKLNSFIAVFSKFKLDSDLFSHTESEPTVYALELASLIKIFRHSLIHSFVGIICFRTAAHRPRIS
jgi:hypothetical protein